MLGTPTISKGKSNGVEPVIKVQMNLLAKSKNIENVLVIQLWFYFTISLKILSPAKIKKIST